MEDSQNSTSLHTTFHFYLGLPIKIALLVKKKESHSHYIGL